MAIILKGNVNLKTQDPSKDAKPVNLSSIKNIADLNSKVAKQQEHVYQTRNHDAATSKQGDINNNIIKPKYIDDKSVVYKASGYLKDLLGEGN